MDTRTNPLGWPKWLWRFLVTFALVVAAYVAVGVASNFARAVGLQDLAPPLSLNLARPEGTPPGWYVVEQVEPGDLFAEAGLKQGDLVRFTQPVRIGQPAMAGVPYSMSVRRGDARVQAEIVPQKVPQTEALIGLYVLWGSTALVTAGLGAALLVRVRQNRAAVMLGFLLLIYAFASLRVPPWAPNLAVAQGMLALGLPLAGAVLYFKPLFAMEISGGGANRKQATIVHIAALAFYGVTTVTVALTGAFGWRYPALILLNNLLVFGIIGWNYRSNDAPARNRIKIVIIALASYLLAAQVREWGDIGSTSPVWQLLGLSALELAGIGLLAYAVLRQKLFDLTFALNRTLVYGTISLVLLGAFGIAKWVIEHLIPESWHAGSEYYSVGIALGLFLVLHRVHNWVERNVERYLFSPWHRNEEALRRFVTAAGHFDQTVVLCRAFTEEASRFAKGAGSALYLRQPAGSYALVCGNLADELPEYSGDDLVMALMRAERRPVRTGETATALPGALALPMLDHGKLAGFLLLDGKPDGTDYRPDEVEVLGWAAHQVGLDLQAMRANELEAVVARLNAKVAELSARGTRERGTRKSSSKRMITA